MRTIVAALLTSVGVLFGGIGVANATTGPDISSIPAATTTVVAQDDVADDDGDNTGLWGLAGLLGLLGLLGLKRRNDVDRRVGTGTGTGTAATRGADPRV
jgi:LPXTG-motif cell wall-anchored protein